MTVTPGSRYSLGYRMAKIKNQTPRGLMPNQKKQPFHWWLIPEAPRKASRLPQLNRLNTRLAATNRYLRRLEGSIGPEEAR